MELEVIDLPSHFLNPQSVYIKACFASGNTAKVIIILRRNSKDAPLLRDLIKDTVLLIAEEKKPWRQVDLISGPLDYKAVALTTSPPPLAIKNLRPPIS